MIERGLPRPVRFAVDLAQKNSEAVSFIPTPRLEQYYANGQLKLAYENDEPAGFLCFGIARPICRIYQACIQYDARRKQLGKQLVDDLITWAERQGYGALSLWCATDLEANEFWRSCGFRLAGQRQGGKRRGRTHNLWVKWLLRKHQPEKMEKLP